VAVVLSDHSRDEYLSALEDGLRELGWVQGQNLVLEARYHEGDLRRIGQLATEFVRLRTDAIVISGVPPSLALKQAIANIPIVVASATDPAATGLVTPGSNVAAFNVLPADSAARQLEMFRQMVPEIDRLAVVWNGLNPASQLNAQRVRQAAQMIGVEIIPVEVSGPSQLEAALLNPRIQNAQAIFLVPDPEFFSQRQKIGELTTATNLPTMAQESDFADAGTLFAYGASVLQMFRQSATYVDRILRGTPPADLTIGPPTRFELVINRRAAKALGFTIDASILAKADRLVD
jgi:putative ABC transport system substrate-binding protein